MYIVSYWHQNNSGTHAVNSSSGTAMRSLDGWTCYTHSIAPSSGQITIAGSGTIDEVRLYPQGARMISYVHQPLLGVAAENDPNTRSTYYEYDGAGRLAIIRNPEKKIIKQFNYQISNSNGAAAWNPTGQVRCKPCMTSVAFTLPVQQLQQIDTNVLSPTYNTLRWVDGGTSSTCTANNWQTISTVCELDSNSQVNGWQITTRQAVNPCLPGYGAQQVTRAINLTACPFVCDSTTCSGVDKKCIDGVCEQGQYGLVSSYFDGRIWHCYWGYYWSDETFVIITSTLGDSAGCP